MDNYSKKLIWLLALLLILVSGLLSLSSAISESQTIDEVVHLSAGYSYLKTGDYRINPEHPPLIKLLSALPLLILNPDLPTNHQSWINHDEWGFAHEFLYHNRINYSTLLILGRLANIVLLMLTSLLLFWFCYREIGPRPALIALTLFAFSPLFLAHSHYITTDLGMASFTLLTLIAFYYYFKKPSYKNLLLLTFTFTLAQLAKFSAVILWPLFILIYLIRWWQTFKSKPKIFSLTKFLITFLILLVVNASLIWAFYSFKSTNIFTDPGMIDLKNQLEEKIKAGTIKNEPAPLPQLALLLDPAKNSGKKINDWLKDHNLPGYYYLRGLIIVIEHNSWGHLTYLNGQISNGGWWYYFPEAFLIKTPLINLLLLVLALIFLGYKIIYYQASKKIRSSWLKTIYQRFKSLPVIYLTVFLFPLVYFVWSITSKINLGVRHLSPIYPSLFIFIGYQFNLINKFKKVITWQRITAVLLALYIISVIIYHPHYLAYFNQLIGSPESGYKYLLDSNLDWGQGLWQLKDYLNEQGINQVYLLYFGSASPEAYGINSQPLPTKTEINPEQFDGVVAISLSALYLSPEEFSWLLKYQPTKVIGYAMNVYDLRK